MDGIDVAEKVYSVAWLIVSAHNLLEDVAVRRNVSYRHFDPVKSEEGMLSESVQTNWMNLCA